MPGFPDQLAACTGFQWDEGNSDKNGDKHRVLRTEAEQVFFNRPVLVAPARSATESRYAALGQTDDGRRLLVVFSVRQTLIRVISARDMSRAERGMYGKATPQG